MLHPWNLSPKEAMEVQRHLASLVILEPLPKNTSLVAGTDVGYCRHSSKAVAAVAVFTFPDLAFQELAQYESSASYPYVPGLLSFREIPLLLKAFESLRTWPQVILCDGQGVAHPRRLGLASHLGLWLNRPTVGCAKTRLVGEHREVGPSRGQFSWLIHRGEPLGVVLRTRDHVKPIYISPGHLAEVKSSRRLVERCCLKTRLPEPIRRAHLAVQRAVKKREGDHPSTKDGEMMGGRTAASVVI